MAPIIEPKITRRAFLSRGARLGLGALGLSAGSLGWGRYFEPDWIEIMRLDLRLPRLPRVFDGFRIAQISDIHIEGGEMRRHFPAIADLVSAQGADAIVLTGDYISGPGDWQGEALFQGFRRLRTREGVFAVLGNHDHYGWSEQPRRAFERANVHLLQNTTAKIERGGDALWLAGLDDWLLARADLAALLAALPRQGTAILLGHEPDFADEVAALGRFDLMLSGHSHGGQIALPFLGPVYVPRGARKYPRGLYRVGDMALYTNRGLGTIGVPIRFCARPEITVFTLKSA